MAGSRHTKHLPDSLTPAMVHTLLEEVSVRKLEGTQTLPALPASQGVNVCYLRACYFWPKMGKSRC